MPLRRLLVPLLVVAFSARPAAALTRCELVCQVAIGKAAHAFLTAELADGARCRMDAVVGKTCDVEDRSTAREAAMLRKLQAKCHGVTLATLVAGGCAAGATTLDALVACLVTGHRALVEQALDAEFGVPAE